MSDITLDLIGENEFIEFKSAKGGFPASFWPTYSAFANAKGGTVYFGIIENKNNTLSPSKLTDEEISKLKQTLFSLIHDQNKASSNLIDDSSVNIKTFKNYPVLEIKIIPAPKEYRPVYVNGNILTGTYRRSYEGDYRCSPSEIKSMLRDASPKSQDLNVVEEESIDELSDDTIKTYRNLLSARHPDHIFLKKDRDEFLTLLGAAAKGDDGKLHPTEAGLLMFGYSYKIVFTFPEYFLDYQEHYIEDGITRWTDRIESNSGSWSGNLFDFYLMVFNKLISDLKIPFSMDGTIRMDESPLHKSIREGLCNAICNSNFYESRGLVVKKYKGRIEYLNPGCLRMSPSEAWRGGESDARNKTIQKMFSLVGIGERAGSGLPLILDTMKSLKYKLPTLNDSFKPERTKLVLHLEKDEVSPGSGNKSSDIREEKIVNYLTSNGPSKAKDIANALGEGLSSTKYSLYNALREKKIMIIGNGKNRTYSIMFDKER